MRSDVTGEVLGRHQCLERLGEGALGVTYRARVTGIGGFAKEFALTRVDRALTQDPARRARLVAAANRAAQLSGERLQQLYEIDARGNDYFLVSELVHGLELGLLLELLRAGGEPLPVPCAILIGLELAEALASAHARTEIDPRGVPHLALSPKTVVIARGGEVRVLQTGLFAAMVAPGWDARKLPTGFLAPEVYDGGPCGGAADVFSIGALLHETIAFRPEGAPVAAIIKRAMDPEPSQRVPSVRALAELLEPHVRRLAARERLAGLVARFGTDQVTPDELPEPAEPTMSLGPIPDRQFDWAAPDMTELPTNIVDSDRSLLTVLSEPAADEPLPLLVPSPPPSRLQSLAPLLPPMPQAIPMLIENRGSAPQLAPPTTLPLAALRVPERPPFGVWWLLGGIVVALAVVALVVARPPRVVRRAHDPVVRVAPLPAVSRALQAERPAAIDAPMTVQTDPAGAMVYLDGARLGTTPLEIRVPRGPHQLAILAERYQLARETVVMGGDPINLHRALTPAAEMDGPAGLKLRCRSQGLRIFVDGVDSGRACPTDGRINTTPGEHFVQLYHPDGDRMVAARRVNLVVRNRSSRYLLDD